MLKGTRWNQRRPIFPSRTQYFFNSSPPGAAPRGEPPPLSKSAERFFLGTPKSGFWGRLPGVKYGFQPLVGAVRSRRCRPRRRFPVYSTLGKSRFSHDLLAKQAGAEEAASRRSIHRPKPKKWILGEVGGSNSMLKGTRWNQRRPIFPSRTQYSFTTCLHPKFPKVQVPPRFRGMANPDS